MSTIVVLGFADEAAVDAFRKKADGLVDAGEFEIEDAVKVVVAEDGTPTYTHMHSLARGGAVVGGILGGVAGLFFLSPVAGAALGAAGGSAIGKMAGDYGIEEEFIHQTAEVLAPGAVALFLQLRQIQLGAVERSIEGEDVTVISTRLAKEAREAWLYVREQELAYQAEHPAATDEEPARE
jgi:uncharacterized membrane protein